MGNGLFSKIKYIVVAIVFIILGVAYFFFFDDGKIVLITDDAPWFVPAVLEVEPGTRVTWKSKAPVVHPVMSIKSPENFHSGHFTKTWSFTFNTPGLYTYICPVHPYMRGIVGVGEKVPEGALSLWMKEWPPEKKESPIGVPEVSGIGEIWVATQFAEIPWKKKPGSLTVVDAKTWTVKKVVDDKRLNNPHNLFELNGKVFVTNWFDKFVSVVDGNTGVLEKHIWVGESPAHVHAHDKNHVYVTSQGDDSISVINEKFEITKTLRAPRGPHGHWLSEDSKLMALASTEADTLSVWDLEEGKILFEEVVGNTGISKEERQKEGLYSLPLMAGITPDGRYAFTATSNEGKFYVFDVATRKLVKDFGIGAGPIQTVISPDGKYVFVPLSGSGALAAIRTKDWVLEKIIQDVGRGAHGVAFGNREGGGLYAYVTNKFETWLTVVDVETLSVAGYVSLGENAWGGQGVIVIDSSH